MRKAKRQEKQQQQKKKIQGIRLHTAHTAAPSSINKKMLSKKKKAKADLFRCRAET
jgi:hypothetical protein